jgi:FdhD protein
MRRSDALPGPRLPSLRIGYDGARAEQARLVPEEVAVALVHDGTTHAVMMATPENLEDFAVGFALTEGVAASMAELGTPEIARHADGIEVRLWLAPEAASRHRARRRAMVGPTGCGLCGVESLEAAVPPPPRVTATVRLQPADIDAALRAASCAQALGTATRATHAAGAWRRGAGLIALREDVGRHNALDKLVGALARAGEAPPDLVVVTSRVSVEMVQKTAVLGAPVLVAISAPTSLAVATAEAAGITLIAVARGDGFEVFTHPDRIAAAAGSSRDVA